MKLYLMRHAHAELGHPMNPSRTITDKGRDQVELMGKFLVGHIGNVELIICSEFRRAVQTARILAPMLGTRYVMAQELDPAAIAYKAWESILQAADRKKDILVITHDPAVNELFAFLTGASASQVRFDHCAIAHIDIKNTKPAMPAGKLHWFVEPKLIEGIMVEQEVAEAAVCLALHTLG